MNEHTHTLAGVRGAVAVPLAAYVHWHVWDGLTHDHEELCRLEAAIQKKIIAPKKARADGS